MTPEQILAIPPRVLTQAQRESYFSEGYILLEKIIGDEWIKKLRDATEELVEKSRKVTASDTIYDLEPDHRPDSPRLRRVSNPTEQHPVFWEYANKSVMPDAVADLVGPDVKFHHSKLNFKWSNGGEEVKWHYDISFWPHTKYSPLTPSRCMTSACRRSTTTRATGWAASPSVTRRGSIFQRPFT